MTEGAPGPVSKSETQADLVTLLDVYLDRLVKARRVVTYQVAAAEVGVAPPHTIHKLALALEVLTAHDVGAGKPIRAALVVSRARRSAVPGSLSDTVPAPGFFDAAKSAGAPVGDDPDGFHESQIRALFSEKTERE